MPYFPISARSIPRSRSPRWRYDWQVFWAVPYEEDDKTTERQGKAAPVAAAGDRAGAGDDSALSACAFIDQAAEQSRAGGTHSQRDDRGDAAPCARFQCPERGWRSPSPG